MSNQDYSPLLLETHNGCCLELVPEFGGLTNRLRFATQDKRINQDKLVDVIVGLSDRNAMLADKVFRGIPLFPFANRIDGGRYRHQGHEYQLPINEPARNNALHGFLYHLTPHVELTRSAQSSEAVLYYSYSGDVPGYPFPADIQIQFVLTAAATLDVSFSVFNRHNASIPVGIGWHPYFGFGDDICDLRLQLPPVQHFKIDARFLPTGEKADFDQFCEPAFIHNTQLDHCFAVQQDSNTNDIAKSVLWSDRNGVGLEIWQQTGNRGLNYIQVCTAADRRSIAIEPVSCGVNAFNTGEGLIELEPGGFFTSHMGVRLLTQLDSVNSAPTKTWE